MENAVTHAGFVEELLFPSIMLITSTPRQDQPQSKHLSKLTVNHNAASASRLQATVTILTAFVEQEPHGLVTAGFVTSALRSHISFSQRPSFFGGGRSHYNLAVALF